MAGKTLISWSEYTWNPIAGCFIKSPGCTNCYAMERVAPRLSANPSTPQYHGTVQKAANGKYVWTGKVGIAGPKIWNKPFTWPPSMIFTNSTSDLFYGAVPRDVVDKVMATIALTPQHKYQILTKRADRMSRYMAYLNHERLRDMVRKIRDDQAPSFQLPMRHAWLGCSVEDQTRADERRGSMSLLHQGGWPTWVSYEPALGPVDWSGWEFLDWIVCGGESGPRCRPDDWDWYRGTRDFCKANNIAFFVKQLGRPSGKPIKEVGEFPADLQIQEWPSV